MIHNWLSCVQYSGSRVKVTCRLLNFKTTRLNGLPVQFRNSNRLLQGQLHVTNKLLHTDCNFQTVTCKLQACYSLKRAQTLCAIQFSNIHLVDSQSQPELLRHCGLFCKVSCLCKQKNWLQYCNWLCNQL